MQSINKFNNSIRALGAALQVPVLDLQKILSTDTDKGYLDEKYAVPDGLHLNRDAYKKLDTYIVDFLK